VLTRCSPACYCVLQLDAPLVVDMRSFPPSVAEAYVHMLMSTLESRAASAAAEGKRQPVAQRVRLIVPPFDHNYVMWPSYVEKLHVHYSEQLLARQVGTLLSNFKADLPLLALPLRWQASQTACWVLHYSFFMQDFDCEPVRCCASPGSLCTQYCMGCSVC